jgi:hypothetical protein
MDCAVPVTIRSFSTLPLAISTGIAEIPVVVPPPVNPASVSPAAAAAAASSGDMFGELPGMVDIDVANTV